MRRPKLVDTGRCAFIEMGEWNGSHHELEGTYPVYKLSSGEFIVLLEDVNELPDPVEEHPNGQALREKRSNKP